MLHTSELRRAHAIGFPGSLKRLTVTLLLVLALPAAASAYTVILLNGRTVEITSAPQFTPSGITYEYAPGIFVTIQRTSIDVIATERANNEPAGSLLRRFDNPQAGAVETASQTQPTKNGARRTLTNEDLRSTRVRREASEAEYERRAQELGLPSLEEMRRAREAEDARMSELAETGRAQKAEAESYWRERARELRTAIAATDAEINYVRRRLDETNGFTSGVSFFSTGGFTSFPIAQPVFNRFPRPAFPSFPPGSWGQRPSPRRPWNGRGNYFEPRRPVYGWGSTGNFRRRGRQWPGVVVLPVPVYGAPYAYDNSYERTALLTRLNELEAERAGLRARWRLLEDEARRAGAPPGWLRP